MTIQRMGHVGIVVDDLAAATAFFVELGLELQGEFSVEAIGRPRGGARGRLGRRCDGGDPGRPRTARADEVSRPVRPGRRPARAGERPGPPLAFAVDDIDAVVASVRARGAELVGEVENYEDIYRLCYVRGPEGIIVELAEQIE
jgi:catechol 2,3-dioxygenase-like lactoylglutathione lyase family enzyme